MGTIEASRPTSSVSETSKFSAVVLHQRRLPSAVDATVSRSSGTRSFASSENGSKARVTSMRTSSPSSETADTTTPSTPPRAAQLAATDSASGA